MLRRRQLLLPARVLLPVLWAAAEERLLAASKPHSIIGSLSTAPAIGPIRAAQIVAIVVAPQRFRTTWNPPKLRGQPGPGFLNVLEGCRHHPVRHLVYASSSSVYGGNTKIRSR